MSDELKKLEEQLEQATAPGDVIDESLDAETKSLREGWLALGRLIDTAQPASDGPPELQYPTQPVPIHRRKPSGLRIAAALSILAASLLVAAIVTLSLKEQPKDVQGRTEIAKVESEGTDNNDHLAWDSSIDSQIEETGQKILSIRADMFASNGTYDSIYYRMQELQQELNDNTL